MEPFFLPSHAVKGNPSMYIYTCKDARRGRGSSVHETANCREGALIHSTLDKVRYIHHGYNSLLLIIDNMTPRL